MGGTSAVEKAQDPYSVPCPFLDGTSGTGETVGKALEELTLHIKDRHTSNLPEPVRTEVRANLTACANTLGGLPV